MGTYFIYWRIMFASSVSPLLLHTNIFFRFIRKIKQHSHSHRSLQGPWATFLKNCGEATMHLPPKWVRIYVWYVVSVQPKFMKFFKNGGLFYLRQWQYQCFTSTAICQYRGSHWHFCCYRLEASTANKLAPASGRRHGFTRHCVSVH